MPMRPRIAVLIPAYNAESYIGRALESLASNAEPHDVVIVDDGSHHFLKDHLLPKPNLSIIRLERNQGITSALNSGLKYILERDYEFVARFDADDICMSERLALQRDFLDRHQEVVLVGGCGRVISEQGETVFYINHPTEHEAIITNSFYNSAFIHPTMMIRTKFLRKIGGYSEKYPNAEDYELTRRSARHGKLANLPQYIIDYRLSTGGLSLSKRQQQLRSRLKIQWVYRDFGNRHFYFGIGKTLALWLLPYRLITAIKMGRGEYKKH
jgi:glycosyltransferase involved in cell wall biosynthesis